jgi:hypothetical protein
MLAPPPPKKPRPLLHARVFKKIKFKGYKKNPKKNLHLVSIGGGLRPAGNR